MRKEERGHKKQAGAVRGKGASNMNTKKSFIGGVLLLSVVTLASGCASSSNPGGLTEREVGGLTGAGVGAGSGAIIGSATGHAAAGAAIGLPIGLATGAIVGEGMRQSKEEAKEAAREEVMKQQYGGAGQPSLVDQRLDVEPRAYTKYNPKTGQRFPSHYELDPVTGDRLEPVRVA